MSGYCIRSAAEPLLYHSMCAWVCVCAALGICGCVCVCVRAQVRATAAATDCSGPLIDTTRLLHPAALCSSVWMTQCASPPNKQICMSCRHKAGGGKSQ